MSGYFVPAGEGAAEYDERRSRFLGRVRPVSGEDEARAFVVLESERLRGELSECHS